MTKDQSVPSSAPTLLDSLPGHSIVNEFGETICYSESPRRDESDPDSLATSGLLGKIARYSLVRILGRGAFGTVFLGHDEQLARNVAIKIRGFDQARGGNGELVDSFLREARQLAQLRHPNIVAVHDVGVEGGQCFIVSDYLEGPDLNHWMRDHQPDWRESARVVAYLCDALAEAHSQGIVHRDIKPTNMIMTSRAEGWSPVLVDFGIALSKVSAGTRGTRRGEIAGTPNYMSPEQAGGEGHRIDGRTDIYALGVILYRMLSGKLPFSASTVKELLAEVIQDEPQPPRQFAPQIPREIEQICLKAMAKQLTDRYTTAADVAEDLRNLLREDNSRQAAPAGASPAGKIAEKKAEASKRTNAADILKILIAEDNEVSRVKLQRDLERWGHTVSTAEDGEEAWELFQNHEYSIVITDWVMPNVDGLQLVQRIRASKKGSYVYVIMLTARAEKHDIVAGMGAGADDFLAKPFHRDELHVRLRAGMRITKMYQRLADNNRRLLRGLEAAGKIQQSYLPSSLPEIPNVQFAWDYRPCDQLGGDMLSVVPLDENNVGMYVLDVSGHGVPASLLATSISRFFSPAHDVTSILFSRRGTEPPVIVEPEKCARRLNQQFAGPQQSGQFFSLIYGILNTETRVFRYSCAGHPPVLHLNKKGECSFLEAFGLPLGVAPETDDFRQESVQLEPGDRLVLYSNGLTNMANPAGEIFGLKRLEQCVRDNGRLTLGKMVGEILGTLSSWHEGADQSDDVSILAVSVL